MLSEPGHSSRHKMGSKYPQSLRCCLPLWAFVLQVAFIILFFFISHDTPRVDQKLMETYQGEGPGEVAKWARGRARHRCSFSHLSQRGFQLHRGHMLGFVSFMSPNWICEHRAGELFVPCPEFSMQMVFIMVYFSGEMTLWVRALLSLLWQ